MKPISPPSTYFLLSEVMLFNFVLASTSPTFDSVIADYLPRTPETLILDSQSQTTLHTKFQDSTTAYFDGLL